MNKDEFVKQLKNAKTKRDIDWINEVFDKSNRANLSDGNPEGHRNLIICMEELAELTHEISKELRGKGDNINILEELADVQLCIYCIQRICKIDDELLQKAINVKTKRLEDKIDTTGIYL